MSLSQFLLILRARWVSGLLVMVATVVLVVLVSQLLPPKYTATASVVLDIRSPDPVALVSAGAVSASSYMATQVDVVQSQRVAIRAVRAIGLTESTELRSRWIDETSGRGDFEDWLSERMTRNLTVRPARESNVMSIAYTSVNPQLAAALANAFMNAYIQTTLELRVEPAREYNSFFDERARALREALEKAQTRLSAYQQSVGLLATDERLDVENSRLSELSSQLVTLKSLADESSSRQAQAGSSNGRFQEALSDSLTSSLSSDLAREQTRLQELGARLGDRHPQVLELQARIAELQVRLDAAVARVNGSVASTEAVNRARLAQIRSDLDAQRIKVLRLKGQRDEALVMQRDVENAQRAYDAMLARVNQSNVESQNTLTNVSVLRRAFDPVIPSSPNVVLNAAVSIVLGALLGLATVVMREHHDRRVRSEFDVLHELRQPLLVTLPVAVGSSVATRPRMLGFRGLWPPPLGAPQSKGVRS